MYSLRLCCPQLRRDILNKEVHADYDLGIIRTDSGPVDVCPHCGKTFHWDGVRFR